MIGLRFPFISSVAEGGHLFMRWDGLCDLITVMIAAAELLLCASAIFSALCCSRCYMSR